MQIKSHEDLEVWQRAMLLAKDIDRIADMLPAHERYGLASQLRRAASSMPANIAEGSARPTLVYINHVRIALGSEAELKTHLKLAATTNLISESDITPLVNKASEIGRMLRGLERGLRAHFERTQMNRRR